MKYTGRIFTVSFYVVIIILVKSFGYFYYDVKLSNFPFLAIVILPLSYWLGKKYDQVKYLSEKDSLTKIYNRRYVIYNFPKLLSFVDKKAGKLSLFLIDIDQFKMINDTFGHEMGDQVLVQLAHILEKNKRKMDIVARWAGDEFLIIAPLNDENNTLSIFKRINQELQKSFDHLSIVISVSIGLSEYPNCAITLDDLLHIADQSMYSAKSQNSLHPPQSVALQSSILID